MPRVYNFKNLWSATLLNDALLGDSTFTVGSLTGDYPTAGDLSGGQVIEGYVGLERVLITAVSGSTWTVSRGQNKTSAAEHFAGATVGSHISADPMNLISQGVISLGGIFNKINDPAFDWCVDSFIGSDSNDGKTIETPFKTLGKARSVYSASQVIGVRAGSQLPETVDFTGVGPSFVFVYGGDHFYMDCADVIPNSSFTKDSSGTTNVYQYAATVDSQSTTDEVISMWRNGVRMIKATSVNNADSNAMSNYWSSNTLASFTMSFNPGNGINPITDGAVYEQSVRGTAFSDGGVGSITRGLVTRRNHHNNGSCFNAGTAINCAFLDGTKHSSFGTSTTIYSNCLWKEAYYAGGGSNLCIFNADTPTGLETMGVFGGKFIMSNTAAASDYATNGPIYSHANISGAFDTMVVSDCYFENCNVAIFAGNVLNLRVDNVTTVGAINGVSWDSCLTHNIRNSHLDCQDLAISPTGGTSSGYICNNDITIHMGWNQGGHFGVAVSSGAAYSYIEGNNFNNDSSNSNWAITGTANKDVRRNNRFNCQGDTLLIKNIDYSKQLMWQDNIYPSGAIFSPDNGNTQISLAAFQAATGQEAASSSRTTVSSYYGGTYSLTATSASVGATVTILASGHYRIEGSVNVKYNGATFASSRTVTVKARKTTNTAADVANSSRSMSTEVTTTVTKAFGVIPLPVTELDLVNGDIVQLWSSLDVVPTAGSMDVVDANLFLTRLY